jgi:hypothetical protein
VLNKTVLKSGLMSFFGAAPSDYAACGQAWANAIGTYAASITPPSTTVAAAQAALGSSLGAAFGQPSAVAGMESALATFAVSVGGGMAGAGYVGTPPPAPVGFALAFSNPPPPPDTHDAAADELATLLDTWIRTGIATLATPPGTVIPWS